MKSAKRLLCSVAIASALLSSLSHAATWQEQLNSAASQLSQNAGSATSTQQSGTSLSALGGLLNSGNQALSADTMNNAAGIMGYCAKNKLASVTSAENIKSQVLEKLGLSAPEQKEDTNFLEGLQGMLNTKDGEQLNLNNIGSTPLAEKVKTKACDLVLKQGMNFLS